jgi:hypothetical protein
MAKEADPMPTDDPEALIEWGKRNIQDDWFSVAELRALPEGVTKRNSGGNYGSLLLFDEPMALVVYSQPLARWCSLCLSEAGRMASRIRCAMNQAVL